MIPLGDYNPTYSRPYVTYGLVAINVMVFLWQNLLSPEDLQRVFLDYSVVPALISRDPLSVGSLLDGFRSMFFHGSWAHLGFNMLYLWVFGDNIEDRLGKPLFLAFYLLCGYMAVAAQVLIDTSSPVPMVGASGAIAGVLGGYFLLYPQARIRTIFFYSVQDVPAMFVLGFWFFTQLLQGAASLGVETAGGGTAFFAHIGGFVAGWILLYVHRQRYGATEMGHYNIGRNPRRAFARGSNTPQQIEPRTDLEPFQRQAFQEKVYAQLAAQDTQQPVYILIEGRAFYGRIVSLEAEKVTLQEKDAQFVIPLENIARVG